MKKIALTTALVLGTASVALADEGFDPNLANRYPAYAAPQRRRPAFTSRSVMLTGGQAVIAGRRRSTAPATRTRAAALLSFNRPPEPVSPRRFTQEQPARPPRRLFSSCL